MRGVVAPPLGNGTPADSLRTNVTSVVSKIGMTSNSTGTASTDINPRDRPPETCNSDVPARKKPMNIDPQSPMKMEAGLKLYTRNPSQRGAKTGNSTASGACPSARKLAARKTAAIADNPGRQPVHVVQQVDGVGDTHQPEERQGHVHRDDGPGQGQPPPSDHRRPEDLPDQLLVRLDVQAIVRQSNQEHPGAAAEHHQPAFHLANQGHEGEGHGSKDGRPS